MLALKGQCENLTSGQGHVRSCGKPIRSCCILADAFMRAKHIEAIPGAWSVFYQMLEEKTNLTSNDPNEMALGQNCNGHRELPNVRKL